MKEKEVVVVVVVEEEGEGSENVRESERGTRTMLRVCVRARVRACVYCPC